MTLKSTYTFARNFLNGGMPAFIILYVTSRCNSRCRYCFYWKEIESPDKKDELTLDEIKKISSKLPRFHQLSLTGGEPTLRMDLPEICEAFSKNNHVSYITIPTNGLLTEMIVKRFEKCLQLCPDTFFRFPLSLDGLEDDYDYLRGTRQGFPKVIQTFHALNALRTKYKNFVIDINTVFSGLNQEKVKKIIDYVHENLDIENHTLTYARGDMQDKKSANTDAKLYREIYEYNQSLQRRKDRRSQSLLLRAMTQTSWEVIHDTIEKDAEILPCHAGRKIIVISEKGEVKPCELLPSKGFGNLRDNDYDLRRMIYSTVGNETRKWIRDTKCHCTWECAVNTNVVFGPTSYPKVIGRAASILWNGSRDDKNIPPPQEQAPHPSSDPFPIIDAQQPK